MIKIIKNNNGDEHLAQMIIIAISFVAIAIIIFAVHAAIRDNYAAGVVHNIKDFLW